MVMYFQKVAFNTTETPENLGLSTSNLHYRNFALAKSVERASLCPVDMDVDDYATRSYRHHIFPEDVEITSVKVYQTAADGGTNKSYVHVRVDDSSILSSAVQLSGSGETTQTATVNDHLHNADQRLEIEVTGDSDDTTPPEGVVTVFYRFVNDGYTDFSEG